MHTYFVWPDGSFVHKDDVDDWTFEGCSDDYDVVYVPDWVDLEKAEEWLGTAHSYLRPYDSRPGGVLIQEELRSLANKLGNLAAVTLDCPNLNSLLSWTEMAIRTLSQGKRRAAEREAQGAEERLNNPPTVIGELVEDDLRDRHPEASANGDVDQVWLD
jgi:hypothetical protein